MLSALKGQRVKVLSTPDQLTLETDHGWTLAVYNRFTLLSDEGTPMAPEQLDGCLVTDTTEFDERAAVAFDNGANLSIDLSDEAFTGPEAMQLTKPSGEIIVWT